MQKLQVKGVAALVLYALKNNPVDNTFKGVVISTEGTGGSGGSLAWADIDNDGYLFPLKPYFAPKNLPEVYLGLEELAWGCVKENAKTKLALEIFNHLNASYLNETTHLKRLDVSKSDAPSYGQREVVLVLEDQVDREKEGKLEISRYTYMLRLSPKSYRQQLVDFKQLHSYMREKGEGEAKQAIISGDTEQANACLDVAEVLAMLAFGKPHRQSVPLDTTYGPTKGI